MMAYNEACSISSWLMSECITYDKRPEQIFSNSLLGIRLGCGVFILQFVVILFFGYDEGSEDSVELDSEPQLTDSIVKTKETKFCTGCGSNRKPSANFCGNCGQDF
jgi:hypothetical protein